MECKKDLFYIFPLNLGGHVVLFDLACFGTSGWLKHHLASIGMHLYIRKCPCFFGV